jgi:hypothetical protein
MNPFGGLLFIGDRRQIRDEEWRTLRNYYKGKFFSIRMQRTAKSAVVH